MKPRPVARVGQPVVIGVDWARPKSPIERLLDELEQLLGPEGRKAFERRHQTQAELLEAIEGAERYAARPSCGRRRRQRYRQRAWRLRRALAAMVLTLVTLAGCGEGIEAQACADDPECPDPAWVEQLEGGEGEGR